MNEKEQVMYNEVYYILRVLGDNYINKMPSKLYEFIKSNSSEKDIDYIDKTKDIADQVSEDTITFISYLNLEYWCSNSEKERLLNIYKDNDVKAEKRKREKYNVDNIFDNKIENIKSENNIEELVMYEEKNWLKKIYGEFIKMIIDWFKKR